VKAALPPVVTARAPALLTGCGILRKEVEYLIAKNGWDIEARFLDSALHNYLDRLHAQLDGALGAHARPGRRSIVLYGCCHPGIDELVERHGSVRTEGQNCIAMLLGHDRFMRELEKGAYFLLEDWALTWEPMITQAFGTNLAVVREIFHSSQKYIVAIRTPCSGDFTAAAEAAAAFIDLPLVWMATDLDHLADVLADALAENEPADR
jgi:hypothetical protein